MMDPRMSRSMSEYDPSDPFADNSPSMEERMLEHRAQRMYQSLAMQGKFSQIDKAKHDKNYRNYLLQNFDEDEMGDYF